MKKKKKLRRNFFFLNRTTIIAFEMSKLHTKEIKAINAAMYQSLLVRRQEMMKESSIFVFDLSKEINLIPFQPLFGLMYITGSLPVIPGCYFKCGADYGQLSYKPRRMERDDHLIIIKLPNCFNEKQTKLLINAFMEDLSDDYLIKIGKMMKQFVRTKQHCTKEQKRLFKEIINLDLSTSLSKKSKKAVLRFWFSDAMVGPICITRLLGCIEFDDNALTADALCSKTIQKLKESVSSFSAIWKFKMNYVIFIDKHYFGITGRENDTMHYPLQIGVNYIGLIDTTPISPPVKESIVKEFQTHYVEGYPKTKQYGYNTVIVKNEQGRFRVKLNYGLGVFSGMLSCLIQVVNGARFERWCKSTEGVGWEIWSGRHEQIKLKDYRMMLQQNANLQREILQLKQALKEQGK